MAVLRAILKQVQLFLLAFTLAAGTLMFTGIASGKLERGETYVALSGQFASILTRALPELAGFAGGSTTVIDARGGVPYSGAAVTVLPSGPNIQTSGDTGNSLQALRMRQRAATAPLQ